MFYTDEGPTIHRFNVCTNTALPDFVTIPGVGFFAMRIMSNGDVLVAAGASIRRFNSAGIEITPAYTAAEESVFFDPDALLERRDRHGHHLQVQLESRRPAGLDL